MQGMQGENKTTDDSGNTQPLLHNEPQGWWVWGAIKDRLPSVTPKQVEKIIGGLAKKGVLKSVTDASYKAANDTYGAAAWLAEKAQEGISQVINEITPQEPEAEGGDIESLGSPGSIPLDQAHSGIEESKTLGGVDAGSSDAEAI